MAIPVSQVNIVGVHAYAGDDLALSASLTSAQTSTSTPVSTGTGATVYVISQLSAGGGNLKIDIADTAANLNFGSPSQTVALSGTGVQAAVQQTSATETYIGFKVEPGGSGITWDQTSGKQGLTILMLYERIAGQEWYDVAGSINMIMSELNAESHAGDTGPVATGSGNVFNTFAKPEDAL